MTARHSRSFEKIEASCAAQAVLVRVATMVDSKGDAMASLAALTIRVDALTTRVDRGFDEVAVMFDDMRQYADASISRLERKVDEGFARIDARLDRMDRRFDRIERKLDQFIDVQMKANELVERRLTALERRH